MLFGKWSATKIKTEGKGLLIVEGLDIMGILERTEFIRKDKAA